MRDVKALLMKAWEVGSEPGIMPVTARVCVNQAAAHYREAELFLEQLRQNRGRNQRGEASLKPCLGAAGWLGDGSGHRE